MYIPCNHEVEQTHELSVVIAELLVSRFEQSIREDKIKYQQKIDAINAQYKAELAAAMARKKPE